MYDDGMLDIIIMHAWIICIVLLGDTVLHDNFGKFHFLTFIILKKHWFTYNTSLIGI